MTETMQALMLTAIHKLEVLDVPKPTLEADDDVLVKVKSVGVCGSDLHGYTGHTGRRVPPLIMGHEATGEVVSVGPAVRDLHPGMPVATLTIASCGQCLMCRSGQRSLCEQRRIMGMSAPGAYAEYVRWPASSVIPLPNGLTYEAGALAEPLAVTVHAVGLATIRPYDTVFVVGAGPIGLLTLAVLRNTAAGRLFISDASEERLARARAIGADVTINVLTEDVRAVVDAHTGGRGVDIAFEAVGLTATAQQSLAVTRNRGQVIWIGNNQRIVEIDMQAIVTRELSVIGSYGMSEEEFKRSLAMLADGKIPVDQFIDRRAALSEGPTLFDDLLESPEIIKCVINF
ncbi:MAG: galactitol-1-phosphate 5-dehydrogenase [Aggregatilineales bacterium]